MALIQVNFRSKALQRTVPMQVILPVDNWDAKPAQQYKTLYLLHGYLDNYVDWTSKSRIRQWAESNNLCVVMPSGDNSFYIDRPETGNCYGQFIGEELVEITRRMFPLSHRREDTFIGGLSMGGFGAMRNGLKYHDTFCAIVSFSGVLELFREWKNAPEGTDRSFEEGVFGKLEDAEHSDKNPIWLAENLAGKEDLPRIYIACGTEDRLIEHNRHFRDLLLKNGYDLTYEEAPGDHNWDFWDTYIHKAIPWLLEDQKV